MKTYTSEQVRELLGGHLDRTKTTQLEFSRDIGISPQHLCDVLKGRREPFGAILDYFGLERSVTYRRKNVNR